MQPKQLILNFNYPELLPYSTCYKNCSDFEILNQAGNRFIEVAEDIKDDFESWWIDWSNPTESGDCLLPPDWSDTFLSNYLQQSIDVSFLDKYLDVTPRLPHDYPETRVKTIQDNLKDEALLTSFEITEILTTAHSESIKEWSNIILKVVDKFQEIKFSYLLNLVELTPAKIYLGILLSDRFRLEKDSDDFYGDFKIKINVNN